MLSHVNHFLCMILATWSYALILTQLNRHIVIERTFAVLNKLMQNEFVVLWNAIFCAWLMEIFTQICKVHLPATLINSFPYKLSHLQIIHNFMLSSCTCKYIILALWCKQYVSFIYNYWAIILIVTGYTKWVMCMHPICKLNMHNFTYKKAIEAYFWHTSTTTAKSLFQKLKL